MRKFAWAARGVAAASGAMLLGALAAPASAAAQGPEPVGNKCSSVRQVASTVVDFRLSGLFGTVFRSATDRQGHAFLNDSRNPGVWINLALLPGAPTCVHDTAVSVTEENPGQLFITLLASDGALHQAQCATAGGAPFTPSTLPAACGTGFTAIPGTPV
ncbi:hypothetical protein B6R96_03640 [Streptomyces sp. Sge12]|uniref:hypothetical protein n=1 Tax=Streptomyces sp. Sge12 TaxID=1972846 RepID=UPI0009C311A5|nr:hypothetical protein [Streptomyces sp. Sge12]ARE73141.1 hypothetical protein B6R96_03640 [Streptomyces sp. Sge12]